MTNSIYLYETHIYIVWDYKEMREVSKLFGHFESLWIRKQTTTILCINVCCRVKKIYKYVYTHLTEIVEKGFRNSLSIFKGLTVIWNKIKIYCWFSGVKWKCLYKNVSVYYYKYDTKSTRKPHTYGYIRKIYIYVCRHYKFESL